MGLVAPPAGFGAVCPWNGFIRFFDNFDGPYDLTNSRPGGGGGGGSPPVKDMIGFSSGFFIWKGAGLGFGTLDGP